MRRVTSVVCAVILLASVVSAQARMPRVVQETADKAPEAAEVSALEKRLAALEAANAELVAENKNQADQIRLLASRLPPLSKKEQEKRAKQARETALKAEQEKCRALGKGMDIWEVPSAKGQLAWVCMRKP